MASSGFCKIGFSPNPWIGMGKIFSNGLEVKIKKDKKINWIVLWKKIVAALNREFKCLENKENKKPYKEITNINKSILPS